MSYGPNTVFAPPITGEGGCEPASYARYACPASRVPSRFAPIFTRMYVPEVGPVACSTSCRERLTRTGRPVRCESIAAIGSTYM